MLSPLFWVYLYGPWVFWRQLRYDRRPFSTACRCHVAASFNPHHPSPKINPKVSKKILKKPISEKNPIKSPGLDAIASEKFIIPELSAESDNEIILENDIQQNRSIEETKTLAVDLNENNINKKHHKIKAVHEMVIEFILKGTYN